MSLWLPVGVVMLLSLLNIGSTSATAFSAFTSLSSQGLYSSAERFRDNGQSRCVGLDSIHKYLAAIPHEYSCHRYQYELCWPNLCVLPDGIVVVLVYLRRSELAGAEHRCYGSS